jgi:hypothetical protein
MSYYVLLRAARSAGMLQSFEAQAFYAIFLLHS